MRRRLALVLCFAVCIGLAGRQQVRGRSSSGSRVFLPLVSDSHEYSFFVAGHTYGVPGIDNPGVHPPFKDLFPELRALGAELGVFTGDIVIRSTVSDWDEIDADMRELAVPVYFCVGNHDMTDRDLFVSRYGPTYYHFWHEGDLFVVLDAELDGGNISGDQLTYLHDVLYAADPERVFVFIHKLIWIVEDTPYYVLRDRINSPAGYDFHSTFWTEVEPMLRGSGVETYVFAGDVGVPWAMSLFYERVGNVHLVASGMGGAEEENLLIVGVGPNGVRIRAHRLDGLPLVGGDISAYDLAHYASGVR